MSGLYISPGVVRGVRLAPASKSYTHRALVAWDSQTVQLTGSDRLGDRPIEGLLTALHDLGAKVVWDRSAPWTIELTGPVRAGTVQVPGSDTSQYVSAILIALAGPRAPSGGPPMERGVSRPYVTATVRLLEHLGASVVR